LVELPSEVRTHKIVDYYYCAERSRLAVLYNLVPPTSDVIEQGLRVHEWLENRPRSEKERKLWDLMRSAEPLYRVLNGVKIIAHPDDLTLTSRSSVKIIEYKTVETSSPRPWKTSLVRFQTQIYAWVLEPYLKAWGYNIAYSHAAIFLTRSGIPLRKLTVRFDPKYDRLALEQKICDIFKFWITGEPLIPPLEWKCRLCPDVFKSKCRIIENSAGESPDGKEKR